jgi:Glycosyl transferases group 1
MKILTLSTYPIDDPKHGGQHRLANIVSVLRDAGHSVQVAGVLGSDSYALADNFVVYPGTSALTAYIDNPFLMDDWAIGELFAKDKGYFTLLADCITTVPDVIHVEQPWLFQFALRYRRERGKKTTKIAYGSQNIENDLKFGILKTYLSHAAAEAGQKRVLECELVALKQADAVFCVSEHDMQWSKTKTPVKTILAQNGVCDSDVTLDGIIEANKIVGHKKSALYCASAHPPNISGFFEIFGAGVGCLSPDEQIVIAGSASQSIQSDPRFAKTAGLSEACIGAGLVSDSCLQGLLRIAHAIILPITHGGGTNLKTAEAMWSGKHVVATNTAMRGFEQYSNSPGVNVQTTAHGFCASLRDAMARPPLEISLTERERRQQVLWGQTLYALTKSIAAMGAN